MAPKFSLQNVLDIRHGKVEVLEIELGKLLASYQKTEAQLLALKDHQADLLQRLTTAQIGDIDMFEMNLLRSNILQVNKNIENTTRELARQNQEVAEKRAALVKAKQSEETLEILKDKRLEVYLAEQVQIEARAQDEIYISQAFRNQRLGA